MINITWPEGSPLHIANDVHNVVSFGAPTSLIVYDGWEIALTIMPDGTFDGNLPRAIIACEKHTPWLAGVLKAIQRAKEDK